MTGTLALLGLGAMGGPMAEVLLDAGVPITVWNRSAGKPASLRPDVVVASTPAEAASAIVLTVLPDLDDVRQVVFGEEGLLAGWQRGEIARPMLVVMGTVSPVGVREFAEELAPHGVRVVDAPLSGGVLGAREARLSIMVGADPGDFDELLPTLEILGGVVRLLGPVGSGQLGKACNQLIVASTVAAISEAMLLARASGLDLGVVQELLLGGLAGSEVLRQKGRNWISESFDAGGAAAYQLKDLNFSLAAAEERGVVLPVTSVVRDLFLSLVANGEGGLDHTAVYRTLQRLSGVAVTAG